jgi:hypothetical protein
MMKEWVTSGWKRLETKHRESTAMDTIQKLVRPFLE